MLERRFAIRPCLPSSLAVPFRNRFAPSSKYTREGLANNRLRAALRSKSGWALISAPRSTRRSKTPIPASMLGAFPKCLNVAVADIAQHTDLWLLATNGAVVVTQVVRLAAQCRACMPLNIRTPSKRSRTASPSTTYPIQDWQRDGHFPRRRDSSSAVMTPCTSSSDAVTHWTTRPWSRSRVSSGPRPVSASWGLSTPRVARHLQDAAHQRCLPVDCPFGGFGSSNGDSLSQPDTALALGRLRAVCARAAEEDSRGVRYTSGALLWQVRAIPLPVAQMGRELPSSWTPAVDFRCSH